MKTTFLLIMLFLSAISCQSGDRTSSDKNQQNTTESEIVGTHWKLIQLEGQDVKMADNQKKEIYFVLKSEGKKVEGFAGCNSINGTYTLEEGQRIHFSQMAVTLRACPDVAINENDYLQVFELADNYTIHNGELTLNVGKRAPLAVFKAAADH